MRKLLLATVFVALFTLTGRAQGTIAIDNLGNFDNSTAATTLGIVFSALSFSYGDLSPETNSFSIEVYGGPSPYSLSPIATLLGYEGQLSAAGAGIFMDSSGGTYSVPGVPLNGTAWIRIDAWEGTYSSYDSAAANGANTGTVTFLNATGGGGVPIFTPVDFIGMPALCLEPNPSSKAVFPTGPQSRTNLAGTTATFSVVVMDLAGDPEPGSVLQWRKNGTNLVNGGNISGVNSGTLTISHVSDVDAGQYYAAANLAQPTQSPAATLTVIDPPTLALQFSGGQPQITLTGAANRSFLVQYSTDLTTYNWVDLFSVSLQDSSSIQFADPGAVGVTARFYRAIMQ